jgi:two-component system LytT family response regulator
MRTIRTVLVDDEPLALESLRVLLETEADIQLVGEYRNGAAFLAAVPELEPDLLFLDVEMPDLSGFDVLEQLHAGGWQPYVVFVTAYDRYAVQAFEEEAFDYVLKPFRADRLSKTLTRIRQELAAAERPVHLTRVAVKDSKGRTHLVRIDEVDWVETAGNYVRLHIDAASHLFRTSMSALEPRLDPSRFVRIHRSTIVNIDRIEELQPAFGRDQIVILRNGTRLRLSGRYLKRLQGLVEGM